MGLTCDPLAVLQAARRHGDLVRLRIGPRSVYAVNAPDLLEQMWVTNGRLFERARPVIGNGLLSSETQTHPRGRRMIQPSFPRTQTEDWAPMMSETVLAANVDHSLDAHLASQPAESPRPADRLHRLHRVCPGQPAVLDSRGKKA